MNKPKPTTLTILENERRYVAKELHDGVAQTSQQLSLQIGICRKLLERGHTAMLAQELATLENRLHLASNQVRELIADMRPPRLEPESSLTGYIQYAINVHHERGGPPVEFEVALQHQRFRFSTEQKLTLMRIVQEALLNSRKHAQANRIRLTLSEQDEYIWLMISDDGCGFDQAEVETRPGERGGGGLANMRARAEALGATLTIMSGNPGPGTEVKLSLRRKPRP